MKNLAELFKQAFSRISRQDRRKIVILMLATSFLALLDLIGVVLLAAVGTLGFRLISPNQRPTRIELIIDQFLGLKIELIQLTLIVGILAIIFLASKTIFQAALSFRSTRFFARIETDIAIKLYQKIIKSPVAESESNSISSYQYSLIVAPNRFIVGYVGTFISLLSDTFSIILMGAFAFYASPISFGLSILVFAITYAFINGPIHKKAKVYGDLTAKLYADMVTQMNEDFLGIREVKIYNQEDLVVKNFLKLREQFATLSQKILWINNIIRYFLELVVLLIGVIILIILVLTSDMRHAVTVLVAYIAIGFRLLPNIQRIQNAINSVRIAQGTTRDLFDFSDNLKIVARFHENLDESTDFREIRGTGVSFSYPGTLNKPILGPMNFAIPAGSTTMILGPSGSGKSTLLDLICKFNEPTIGTVEYYSEGGQILRKLPPIGLVSQKSSLFGDNLIENVTFAKNNSDSDLRRANEIINWLNLEKINSGDIQKKIRSDGTNISGGERQRISMARIMYKNPQVVVLDEPTSSLDLVNRESIYEFLNIERHKKTIILVSHEIELLDYCDHVIQMENGEILFQGSAIDFKNKY